MTKHKESKGSEPANTKVSRAKNGQWLKGTPSPNPKGRPSVGESWKEIIEAIGKMTSDRIHGIVGNNDLGRAFQQMPKGIPMRDLVVMRVFSALMFEPQSGLWNTLIERVEGKVPQPLQLDVTEELRRLMHDLNLTSTDIASDSALALVCEFFGVKADEHNE